MLILDQRERCGEWARARIANVDGWGEWYQAIGWEIGGELKAVAIFNNYLGADVWIHLAIERGSLQWRYAIFAYAFLDLRVRHITAYIPARNSKAQKLAEHIGFRFEGRLREAWIDDDVVLWGMIRSECRWL